MGRNPYGRSNMISGSDRQHWDVWPRHGRLLAHRELLDWTWEEFYEEATVLMASRSFWGARKVVEEDR